MSRECPKCHVHALDCHCRSMEGKHISIKPTMPIKIRFPNREPLKICINYDYIIERLEGSIRKKLPKDILEAFIELKHEQ